MSTPAAYATVEAFAERMADHPDALANLDAAAIERALEQASRDLDTYLGWDPPEDDDLRIDPDDLSAYAAGCLARATIAQAAMILGRGWDVLVDDFQDIAATGGISFASRPGPRLSPAAVEALAGARLVRRTGTVPAEGEAD